MVCSNPELEAYGTEETKPLLVLEVSDSSLGRDPGEKAILYAKAEVPEYWVANLVDGVLEVFRAPRHGSYRAHWRLGQDAQVIPLAWPDLELDVFAFFPTDLTNLHRPEESPLEYHSKFAARPAERESTRTRISSYMSDF